MLSEAQLGALPLPVQKLFQRLETDTITRICERIGAVGKLSASDIHRLDELSRIGYDIESIEREIANTLKISADEVGKIFTQSSKLEYDAIGDAAKFIGRDVIPFADNARIKELLDSIIRQTSGELINLSQSNVIGFLNAKNEFRPLTDYYRETVDYAILQVRTGQTDFHSAMRSTIKAMADDGLTHYSYATGRKIRLDSAVRMSMLTGQAKLSRQQAEITGEQFGADGMEISWHSAPRPSHEDMGGKQYPMKEYEKEIVHLLEEPNCYHRAFPIIMNISPPVYSDEELARMNAADKATHTFEGKQYSKYDATQMQRRLETSIRREKDETIAFDAIGDTKSANISRAKAKVLQNKYAEFSKSVGLSEKFQRTAVAGYNHSKGVVKNAQKLYNNGIHIDTAQFGKKIGKHAIDYGLSPSDPTSRDMMRNIIDDIVAHPTEIRQGLWNGQGALNAAGNKTQGIVDFFIKGNDVVVAKDGKFISILKDGVNNNKVKYAKKV